MEQAIPSASSDPLLIPNGPITRVRAKRFKEAMNRLIKDIRSKQMGQESTIVKKDLTSIQVAMEGFLG